MLIIDRVVCDFCHCLVGQVFSSLAQAGSLLSDLTVAPNFCVCPDCTLGSDINHIHQVAVSVRSLA